MSEPDLKSLERARTLLKKGDLDGAVRAFVAAHAVEDAARALASAARFVEAADVLLASLNVDVRAVGNLRDPKLRARAHQAAALLRQGGMSRAADELEDGLEQTGVRFGATVRDDEEDEKTVRARKNGPFAEEKTEIATPLTRVREALTRDTDEEPPRPQGRTRTGTDLARPPSRPPPGANYQPDDAPKSPRPKMIDPLPPDTSPQLPTTRAAEASVIAGFESGTVIAERYELGPLIGRGGMGRVFRAKDLELSQDIAIKVFDRMDDKTLLARFKQELLSSRQIAHPNVLRIFDIGTHAEQKYLTMELLVGQDLKERLLQPIAFSESLDLLAQACRGLAAAHAVGVIHRDIKPQNLFITQQKVVKLMDFGIAKLQAAARLTNPGTGVGTPEFMAPEQILDSSGVSAATDLYAIGVTAYRMFTGRVPFHDKDMLRLFKKQLHEDPPPLRQVNPKVPLALEAVVLKLLSKKPELRYQDANEVAAAFASFRAKLVS